MMKVLALLPALLCSLCSAASSSDAHWCYKSQKTPSNTCKEPEEWKTQYKECGKESQSPINIITKDTRFTESLIPLTFKGYNDMHLLMIKNNGHSVQVELSKNMQISDGGLSKSYRTVQFHLHWGTKESEGSEHLIDGRRYPAELHIVHEIQGATTAKSDEKPLAVLGFFFEKADNDNDKYEPLIHALKDIPFEGNSTAIGRLKLKDLIPEEAKLHRYFRYNGSLTTPACNETVVWTIFEEPIPLSQRQIEAFSEHLFFPDGKTKMKSNFRPTENLNDRVVCRSSANVPVLQGATLFITSVLACLIIGLQH
ncbi:carbonic anhydrase 4 [Pleurodeles waltl]|uniref:carbonic anhydrase 4 n=1 Tax=Pleurodeles waltl TaxID=8319 RepID=UPI003709AE63